MSVEGNPNFRLRLHHLKIFDSGHSKLLGLRLHSPWSCTLTYVVYMPIWWSLDAVYWIFIANLTPRGSTAYCNISPLTAPLLLDLIDHLLSKPPRHSRWFEFNAFQVYALFPIKRILRLRLVSFIAAHHLRKWNGTSRQTIFYAAEELLAILLETWTRTQHDVKNNIHINMNTLDAARFGCAHFVLEAGR